MTDGARRYPRSTDELRAALRMAALDFAYAKAQPGGEPDKAWGEFERLVEMAF